MQKAISGTTEDNLVLIPKGRYFDYYKLARERSNELKKTTTNELKEKKEPCSFIFYSVYIQRE